MDLAIETALTLRAVFRLALRQSEGMIGSIMGLLTIDLPVADHTTLSRRAGGLQVHIPRRNKTGDLHLIADSTGLRLHGAGEWLLEKHGTAKRRVWRKLHIGIDAASGEIVAFDLTDKDVDDASHVPTLLDQLMQAPASFIADGAYDRTATYDAILARNPFARFHRPAMQRGCARTDGDHLTNAARLAFPCRGRARADELAEGVGLQQALKGRGCRKPLQARHRRHIEIPP